VTVVREQAKAKPRTVGKFARRPARIWVADVDESMGEGGVRTFTSTYKGNTITRQLYVSPEGERRAKQDAWPPARASQ
jgi:hypothetical protein